MAVPDATENNIDRSIAGPMIEKNDNQSDQERIPTERRSKRNDSNTLFVWGSNTHGQLGLGDKDSGTMFSLPQKLTFSQRINKVACGGYHAAMVTETRQLFVMGSNTEGQLGVGSFGGNIQVGEGTLIQRITYPTLVDKLAHIQITEVACGQNFTVCIGIEPFSTSKDSGRQFSAYAWGDNSCGQCGVDQPEKKNVREPLLV